ncbi:hypothetical protein CCACVL1_28786 [Corchorus capsularis]|uniref:3-phosphoinositide-dependent protein kinase-1 n=1 Tax=Corchorus capsularis TaxID=210143 RepID=A0A1R3G591_COCAP|nr:hypothetical protein CCACVL1_28786 [Corchorus capsularis]
MIGAIWEEIERSESFLVCSMYEEAASLASSVIKQRAPNLLMDYDFELYEAMEAAGMVLVQSLKQLSRTSAILNELKTLFGSVEAIPVEVLLTGACFQISEASTLGAKEFLEEFLHKWRYVDDQCYVLGSVETNLNFKEGCDSHFVLRIDKYIEVVELYAVMLLGTVSSDLELAISWVEHATLPEKERQRDSLDSGSCSKETYQVFTVKCCYYTLTLESLMASKTVWYAFSGLAKKLLRRLHYLYSTKATNSSPGSLSHTPAAKNESHSSLKGLNVSGGTSKGSKSIHQLDGENSSKQAILKLCRQPYGCLWWFRNITLKFSNYQLLISNGKILIGCLIFLLYYILRRKEVSLRRIVRRQVLFVKKSIVDLWQLAFSYQVNPLAAIQPLSAAS